MFTEDSKTLIFNEVLTKYPRLRVKREWKFDFALWVDKVSPLAMPPVKRGTIAKRREKTA